eukprot:7242593-Prymnesium_polylepis.1
MAVRGRALALQVYTRALAIQVTAIQRYNTILPCNFNEQFPRYHPYRPQARARMSLEVPSVLPLDLTDHQR